MCCRLFKNSVSHIAGALLFAFIFLSMAWFIGLGNDEVFDAPKWQISSARERGRMAQHLVDGGTLVGLSEVEVLSKLGSPEMDWGRVHQYQIDLGWPLKKPTTYGLQVHYDAGGNVRMVKIVD